MAGLATAEAVLGRDASWRVTMLGEETVPTYNRILLSKLLSREVGPGDVKLPVPSGVDVRVGCPAVAIDVAAKTVTDAAGGVHAYDALVIATGSRPFVPPVAGGEVLAFRTQADVDAIEAEIRGGARRAVVLGGGLLGLEAAAGLRARGLEVAVVEAAPRLMGRQLDDGAATMVATALTALGVPSHPGRTAKAVLSLCVELDDGTLLPADVVVASAGVRPETTLARDAGLRVARGIVVDDALRAGPGVWAVGECAEHRGTVYGLWAPLAEQARVAGATIAGDPAGFQPVVPATTLKVAGVDLYTGGRAEAGPGEDELVVRDTRRGVYRKLVLDGDRLVGAILLGDAADARRCTAALRGLGPAPELLAAAPAVADDPDGVVCSCNGVSGAEIDDAIRARGLTTLAAVARATRATTGCGGCAADVRARLAQHVAA
jgi:NAD(P)H-nitrite reductase large subunit